jgi:hypothetical protein
VYLLVGKSNSLYVLLKKAEIVLEGLLTVGMCLGGGGSSSFLYTVCSVCLWRAWFVVDVGRYHMLAGRKEM